MHALARRAWNSPELWRYVDAYGPRVFGLVIHTALVIRHGMQGYALPTWVLGAMGLALAVLPDPHALILVRKSPRSAKRLLALGAPWVLFKVIAAATVCWAAVALVASREMLAPHEGRTAGVLLAATILGGVEYGWAVLGTASLAIGNVREVALSGLLARTVALLVLGALAFEGTTVLSLDLLAASLPVLVAFALLAPFRLHPRGNLLFVWYATRRYGAWSQGISLVTAALFQAPSLVMGAYPVSSAAGVGQVSYVSRLIGAALQPVQILQSFVVREFVVAGGRPSRRLTTLRWLMRASALGIGGIGLVGLIVARARELAEPGVLVVMAAVVFGVAFSCWYRFELSRVISTTRIRALVLSGYLPVSGVALLVGALLVPLAGSAGLAAALGLAWAGLALSWMWVPHD